MTNRYATEPTEILDDELKIKGLQFDLANTIYKSGGNGITGNRSNVFSFDWNARSSSTSINNLIFGGTSSKIIGTKWGTSLNQGINLTYSFTTPSSIYANDPSFPGSTLTLNSEQITTARAAMQVASNITKLTFSEVADSKSGAGDIRWARTGNTASVSTSAAYRPEEHPFGGDIWIGTSNSGFSTPSKKGTYGYQTFLHELGHALGLLHPHSGTVAPISSEDQLKYSIMSYRDYAGDNLNGYTTTYFPTSFMLNDIAALQYLYGANTTYQSGNNTYSWAANTPVFETIYDSGGIDTISASNQTAGALINLNPGSWSQIGSSFWNGRANVRDCLTIAYSTTIENATGSMYNDTLIGNAASNILDGGAGIDIMTGGLGDDTYYFDNELDKAIESTGQGYDKIYSTSARTIMGAEIEELYQTANGFFIDANNSNNYIAGNPSNNEIYARQGDDTVSAGAGNDIVYGNPGNDTLYGGFGNDMLYGGAGNDILSDRDGNDTYGQFFRGFGLDKIYETEESTKGSIDRVNFTNGDGNNAIYHNQIWFARKGNDLEVSIIGQQNNSTLTIDSWYLGKDRQIEIFHTDDDNKNLSSTNIDKLVNAMAAFSPPALGQYTLPSQYQQSLNAVISSCWT